MLRLLPKRIYKKMIDIIPNLIMIISGLGFFSTQIFLSYLRYREMKRTQKLLWDRVFLNEINDNTLKVNVSYLKKNIEDVERKQLENYGAIKRIERLMDIESDF